MYENHSPEIKIFYICCALKEKQNARMVKLVDTLVSGTSDRKVVQVRVLFRALKYKLRIDKKIAEFFFPRKTTHNCKFNKHLNMSDFLL